MSLDYSLFKYKKIIFILVFFCTCFSLSESFPRRNSDNKCEYGVEYIKGKCINPSFDMIQEAVIDESGTYKYIQIKCAKKYIFIRGRKDCKYHKNIYNKFLEELKINHLDKKSCKVLGGGRIKKSLKKETIKIYGYSNRYGRAENQHETTKNILEKFYPKYEITWTNDGY